MYKPERQDNMAPESGKFDKESVINCWVVRMHLPPPPVFPLSLGGSSRCAAIHPECGNWVEVHGSIFGMKERLHYLEEPMPQCHQEKTHVIESHSRGSAIWCPDAIRWNFYCPPPSFLLSFLMSSTEARPMLSNCVWW